MTSQQTKKTLQATEEQIAMAYALARARIDQKDAANMASVARQDIIDTLSSEGDFDVQVIDEKGRTVFESSESVIKGGIDWKLFTEENPDIDLDKYRKPATTSITIRTGGMIDAIAEEARAATKDSST